MVGGARCSSTSSPCAMGVMAINLYNNNWSHDSDSLLEMTPVVSSAVDRQGPFCSIKPFAL